MSSSIHNTLLPCHRSCSMLRQRLLSVCDALEPGPGHNLACALPKVEILPCAWLQYE